MRLRRPTSSSSPRRLWWSCLCSRECSVRSLMRRVSIAIWTSGEPVSPSLVAYSSRISFFTAASRATVLLRVSLRGASGLVHLGSLCPRPVSRRSKASSVLVAALIAQRRATGRGQLRHRGGRRGRCAACPEQATRGHLDAEVQRDRGGGEGGGIQG